MSQSRKRERPGSGEAWPLGQAGPSPSPAAGRRRRRYSPEEKAWHVARWRAAGGSAEAYARQAGVVASLLRRWRHEDEEGGSPTAVVVRRNPRNPTGRTRVAYSDAERVAAVAAYHRSGLPQRVFAQTWGLSIKTLGTWLSRVRQHGEAGLKERQRGRPKGSRNQRRQPAALTAAILQTRQCFPDFGLRKVAHQLARFAGLAVSPTTVRTTLARHGVPRAPTARKARRSRPLPRRFERARPNQLWQSDITSLVLPRPGNRVYLTVFLDDHSRYVVSWALSSAQRGELVIEALRDGVARFGKPAEVLTDQGRQYFSWRGKSDFQKELSKLGIAHVVSRSHHPETLGKCERLWETVQTELWSRCSPLDITEARERLAHFFAHYNHFRPHQGISGSVPADRFFGAESTVRGALERNLSANELHLALGEAPRQPVFLVGQIGEQAVSLHGERGRLVVLTPQGRQELNLEELGAAAAAPEEERDEHDGAGEGAAAQQKAPLPGDPAAGAAGAGAVGGGERGGEGQGAHGVHRDPGVVGGAAEPAERGDRAADQASARLAIEPIGTLWDAGGPAPATEATREGSHEGGLGRHESGSGGAEEGAGRAEAAQRGAGAPGDPAAGAAGEQGEIGPALGEREGASGGDPPSGGKKEARARGCESP